nr:MAG TPA: hypothetical protein [Caudoviricetes sp.]
MQILLSAQMCIKQYIAHESISNRDRKRRSSNCY